jgi:hypothetical protein
MRRLLALTLLISSLLGYGAIAAGLTPAALAAGSGVASPTLDLSNAQQAASTPQTTTVAPVTTTSSSGGLSGLDAILIGAVAVLLLCGIAFWVWRDSRRHAAELAHHASDDTVYGGRAHSGSKTPHKPRKLKPAERKRRKRGKAR